MEVKRPKKRRVYTVEAFLQRELRGWRGMVLRPRASLLKDTRVVRGPLDRHVDRHVYPLARTPKTK